MANWNRMKFFGNTGADNGIDEVGILVNQTAQDISKFSIGISNVIIDNPLTAKATNVATTVGYDTLTTNVIGATSAQASQTWPFVFGVNVNQWISASSGKTAIATVMTGVNVMAPTKLAAGGTETINYVWGVEIRDLSGLAGVESAAIKMANNNGIVSVNNAGTTPHVKMLSIGTDDVIDIGDTSYNLNLDGSDYTVADKQLFRTAINSGLALQTAGQGPVAFANATTYYLGFISPLTAATLQSIVIPRAGKVKTITVYMWNNVLGSNEASTISFRLNNSTDTTISAAVNNSSSIQKIVKTGLDITVAQGDTFEIKWVTPTWVTNPTTYMQATVYIE